MRAKIIGQGEYVNAVFTRAEFGALHAMLFDRLRRHNGQEAAASTRVLRKLDHVEGNLEAIDAGLVRVDEHGLLIVTEQE